MFGMGDVTAEPACDIKYLCRTGKFVWIKVLGICFGLGQCE